MIGLPLSVPTVLTSCFLGCRGGVKSSVEGQKGIQVVDQPSQNGPHPSLSLPSHQSERLSKFIGEKALTQSSLNRIAVNGLLDTGAQVSMIDGIVRPLSDVLDDQEESEVHAVNGDVLPFDGWVLISVSFGKGKSVSQSITVPFLISSIPLERTLLGFNVLEEVIHITQQKWFQYSPCSFLMP